MIKTIEKTETLYGVDDDNVLYVVKAPSSIAMKIKALLGSQAMLGNTIKYKLTGIAADDSKYVPNGSSKADYPRPFWKELINLLDGAHITKIRKLNSEAAKEADFDRLLVFKLNQDLL